VTPEDIQRVANKYFKPENRAVAVYYTKGSEDPLLTGLSDEEKGQIRQFKQMLGQVPADRAKMMLQQIEQAEAAAPEDKKRSLRVMKKLIEEKIGGGKP